MKVCGFSIAYNALRFGYPIEASLRSMLPLVDELILNIGEGDGDTWNLVQSMQEPKIRTFRSWWDPNLRVGGQLLAQQTNLALERCNGDWGIYLQADEVLHEKDYPLIRQAMERHRSDSTEAIRFRYHHFYGSFQTVQDYPRTWYTRANRIVKLGIGASSSGDAMDFCLRREGREWLLRHADIDAHIYHYGWSRPPEIMRAKRVNFERLYRDDAAVAGMSLESGAVYPDLGNLRYFRGAHPTVMRHVIESQNWQFDHGIERQQPEWYRHARVWAEFYLHRALPFAGKAGQRLLRRIKSR